MTVSTLAPRARRRMKPPEPPDVVTQYALDVVAGRLTAGKLVRLAAERHLRDLADGGKRGLVWDPAAAMKAIDFFPLLRHYKGQWGPRPGKLEGDPIRLEAWQCFIVGSSFGWRRADGLRRFRNIYIEVAKKNGKAVSLDTPLPTPTGWTTMGELRVGDQLIDEHGAPCRVTFATEVMCDHDCYRVEFSDGTSVIADADHLWETERLDHHAYTRGVRTTREIAATLARGDGARRHRIPVAGALQLHDAELPLDPYLLGVWLGDGSSGGAYLTIGDQDEELVRLVAGGGVTIYRQPTVGRTARYRLGGTGPGSRSEVATTLRTMGLIGNKHVPAAYLRGSVAQRLALVQGLMDTDGHVTSRGQCEFTTTRPQLRDAFLELARSLGYKPVAREGMATLNGRQLGPKWRITFHGQRDRPPFRLARKLLRVAAVPERVRRSSHRHIVTVAPVPSVPVRCIQVDSPSHLFLAGPGMVPTHNTLMAAGIGLLLAFFDDEPGAEVYSAATKRDQAKLVWKDAAQMVKKNLGLRTRIQVLAHSLTRPASAQLFQPLGKDSDTDQGINPHGAIIDELHVLDDREVVDNIETAASARSQPMIVKITTAGVKRESVWADERADAVSILEGRATDDSTFAIIYTLDEGDDPFEEAVWPKANPNLGVSVMVDTLRDQAAKAKRSPAALGAYLRFRMNIPTAVSTRAIAIEEWDACAGNPDELPYDDWLDSVLPDAIGGYEGLDLASVKDLTALVILFRMPGEDVEDEAAARYVALARFWCPADGIRDRSRRDGVPYEDWVRDGYLIETPGNITDYSFVRSEQLELAAKYAIGDIGFDKWNATQLVTELQADGATCTAIPQTHAGLGPAWRELEKLILEHRLMHGGHPILRWMAGNVEVEMDANGNQKPSKRRSAERIDGIVALTMAENRWLAYGEAPGVWTAA